MSMKKVGVLGAGTWGMALARLLVQNGHRVTVWSALPEEIDDLSATRRHPNLPGMVIPQSIVFTKDIADACREQDLILFAVPSVFVRQTAQKAAPFISDGQVIVDVAKGIEPDTLMTMTQVIEDCLPQRQVTLVALSGPTHAEEVALDLPTTIVSASEDPASARLVQEVFSGPMMRVYTNADIRGVELCGAMKNIIALASGVATGLGYGDNIRAALITRGMAEIARLGTAMGCDRMTFGGLAGMGDLIVTATSRHSRNNRCGMLLGQGIAPQEAVRQVGMVVEGIHALDAAMSLKERYNVEMPIVDAVNALVKGKTSPQGVTKLLMGRDQKSESMDVMDAPLGAVEQ